MCNFFPCGKNRRNHKSCEEAQAHQAGEQDQLVGRRVRKQRVNDSCGQLGSFQAERSRGIEAVLVLHFSRNSSNPGPRDWTNFSDFEKSLSCSKEGPRAEKVEPGSQQRR
ncbi:hypothetical protein M513_08358 [Trichuris suis]|uniref:Uncharacterized protein n=1 Tax=Trichuris suis TaxID=68888 RepID=A0A085M0F6_9BILA|nr:hypothetical protein M513_08358 [Trichuris suis]